MPARSELDIRIKITVIEEWLDDFSYLDQKDVHSDFFRGLGAAYREMRGRLAVMKLRAGCS